MNNLRKSNENNSIVNPLDSLVENSNLFDDIMRQNSVSDAHS